ncbi:hypothetical protein [Bosea sp. MMO-172]|uniref:hypothetical protein n=1 Tax=Bosea sp. MMO-172 TaxID=3127885 RepID=UPI00301B39A3
MNQKHSRSSWTYWTCLSGALILCWGSVLALRAGAACAETSGALIQEIAKSNGCVEFWVNRYQATIAAGIAAAVAFFALRPVFYQLYEIRKQSAHGEKAILEAFAKDVDDELDAVREINGGLFLISLMAGSFNAEVAADIPEDTIKEFESMRSELSGERRIVRTSDRRLIGSAELIQKRKSYIKVTDEYFSACRSYFQAVRIKPPTHLFGDQARNANLEIYKREAAKALACSKLHTTIANEIFPKIEALSAETWREIRRLERKGRGLLD